MSQHLTLTQASVCLEITKGWIARTDPSAAADLALYPPGFHADGYTIALEGGPEDWPWHLTQDETITMPGGIFAEPVNGWCLGLYPDHDRYL